jgi:hypothetical protein
VNEVWHKRLQMFAVACILAGTGYAFGRYSAPDRVVTKEHETVRTVTQVDTRAQEEVVALRSQLETLKRSTHRVETVKPDGTRTVTTDTNTERNRDTTSDKTTHAEQQTVAQTETTREVTKTVEVTRERPQWRVGPLVGFDLRTRTPVYGGIVERRILGPVSLGAVGLSNGTLGLSLTLEF